MVMMDIIGLLAWGSIDFIDVAPDARHHFADNTAVAACAVVGGQQI